MVVLGGGAVSCKQGIPVSKSVLIEANLCESNSPTCRCTETLPLLSREHLASLAGETHDLVERMHQCIKSLTIVESIDQVIVYHLLTRV